MLSPSRTIIHEAYGVAFRRQMKDMSEISTLKPARAKRTLPTLPKSKTNGVFLSPTCSPKTARRNCANPPLTACGKDKPKPSRLPIRRTQSLSEIAVRQPTHDKLRKQATIADNGSEFSRSKLKSKETRIPTAFGELNPAKGARNSALKKQANCLNRQQKTELKTKTIQGFISDALNHSRPSSADGTTSRLLTKSESINSLDSLSGVNYEEEQSCVTVAVRVRPFNQR